MVVFRLIDEVEAFSESGSVNNDREEKEEDQGFGNTTYIHSEIISSLCYSSPGLRDAAQRT